MPEAVGVRQPSSWTQRAWIGGIDRWLATELPFDQPRESLVFSDV